MNPPVQLVCQGFGRSWTTGQSLNLPDQTKMCIKFPLEKKRQNIKDGLKDLEKRFGSNHFSHNGAQRPNVNRGGVLGTSKQDFRGSGKRGDSMFKPKGKEAWKPFPELLRSKITCTTEWPPRECKPWQELQKRGQVQNQQSWSPVSNGLCSKTTRTNKSVKISMLFTPSLSMRRFAGFKSLCITRRWWQKSSPC